MHEQGAEGGQHAEQDGQWAQGIMYHVAGRTPAQGSPCIAGGVLAHRGLAVRRRQLGAGCPALLLPKCGVPRAREHHVAVVQMHHHRIHPEDGLAQAQDALCMGTMHACLSSLIEGLFQHVCVPTTDHGLRVRAVQQGHIHAKDGLAQAQSALCMGRDQVSAAENPTSQGFPRKCSAGLFQRSALQRLAGQDATCSRRGKLQAHIGMVHAAAGGPPMPAWAAFWTSLTTPLAWRSRVDPRLSTASEYLQHICPLALLL